MHRLSPRRWRLAATLIAPSLATLIAGTAVHAAEPGRPTQLYPVVVQTAALQESDQPAESAIPDSQELEGSVSDAMQDVTQGGDADTFAPPIVGDATAAAPSYALAPCGCCTKKDKEAAMAKMKEAFAGVFYANNFSYLKDPCYDGPEFCGDCLKDIDTACGNLSFGGETRFRFHNERNFRGLGITGRDDNFWLFRQRLYADWKMNDLFRVYGEVLDANSSGETFAPRPIEENDLDIQNLFVDVNLLNQGAQKLTARIGRQELLYGAQRTVSPLDWANVRRTFEGVRMLYQNGDTSVDGFWTEFVPIDPKDADEASSDQQFYGVYATRKGTALGQLEAYYLGYENDIVGFNYQTIGSRASGKTDGGWLYDFEGAYQFGDNTTPDDQNAGFFTGGLGRNLGCAAWSPTVWFYYDYASGEEDFDEVGRGDGGYDHLFPLAHKYNGFMDLFGRRNLHDINVFSVTPLSEKISVVLWYHYFRLDQQTTPYSVVMTPYNTVTQAQSKDLGHEIDLLFNINLNPRNNVLLGYSHFSGGDYYDTPGILPPAAGTDSDGDFFYAQFQTRY
ncbi:hypothetical protein FYK55_23120 [Roseiconus nitratireducens]|uniref:Alginate export domain-containing protein n=1 Tax=Roseiconus nitratireducens TaxID=2605748 RepID=A0A5M6CWU1_9BACT|nr:alginate export family protein [Roseiconus nitratireducens]KAA5539698.1 hypothetical protein FYK55_23120 [Roseiconus nitratireducens]